MTIENASLSIRKDVLVPTRAELAEAAKRDRPLSSTLLRETRAETQVATRPAPITPPGLAVATTVMRLQKQIAKLKNENTKLKAQVMAAG